MIALKIGEVNTILIGVENGEKRDYNITAVYAHINSVFDKEYFIQNVRWPCDSLVVSQGFMAGHNAAAQRELCSATTGRGSAGQW